MESFVSSVIQAVVNMDEQLTTQQNNTCHTNECWRGGTRVGCTMTMNAL